MTRPWWNDLAGAYLRLGRAKVAAELLEPVIGKFDRDYGMHANLGTAYHLLGRYAEAEREIARDLEINPEGHGGLEKYHLALLQYLVRAKEYQAGHVFVDEFTPVFQTVNLNVALREKGLAAAFKKGQGTASVAVNAPSYRHRWNLADDPKLLEGVAYMARLNRDEPACFVMLGVTARFLGVPEMALPALDRAIRLQSPQGPHLKNQLSALRLEIRPVTRHAWVTPVVVGSGVVIALLIGLGMLARFRKRA